MFAPFNVIRTVFRAQIKRTTVYHHNQRTMFQSVVLRLIDVHREFQILLLAHFAQFSNQIEAFVFAFGNFSPITFHMAIRHIFFHRHTITGLAVTFVGILHKWLHLTNIETERHLWNKQTDTDFSFNFFIVVMKRRQTQVFIQHRQTAVFHRRLFTGIFGLHTNRLFVDKNVEWYRVGTKGRQIEIMSRKRGSAILVDIHSFQEYGIRMFVDFAF